MLKRELLVGEVCDVHVCVGCGLECVCVCACMVCVNYDMYELCCTCDTYQFLLRFFYFVIRYKFDLIMKLPNYLIQQLSPHLIKLFKKLDKSVEQKCALHTNT